MMSAVCVLSSRRLYLLPFVLIVSTQEVRSKIFSCFRLIRRMLVSSLMRRPVFTSMKMACCASPFVRRSMYLISSALSTRWDSFFCVARVCMYCVGFLLIILCCSRYLKKARRAWSLILK